MALCRRLLYSAIFRMFVLVILFGSGLNGESGVVIMMNAVIGGSCVLCDESGHTKYPFSVTLLTPAQSLLRICSGCRVAY